MSALCYLATLATGCPKQKTKDNRVTPSIKRNQKHQVTSDIQIVIAYEPDVNMHRLGTTFCCAYIKNTPFLTGFHLFNSVITHDIFHHIHNIGYMF